MSDKFPKLMDDFMSQLADFSEEHLYAFDCEITELCDIDHDVAAQIKFDCMGNNYVVDCILDDNEIKIKTGGATFKLTPESVFKYLFHDYGIIELHETKTKLDFCRKMK